MYYLPTSIIFILFAILTFIYTIKNREEKKNKGLFVNELLVGLLFFIAGALFPFLLQSHSISIPISHLNFMWLTTSLFLIIELTIWSFMILYGYLRHKKKNNLSPQEEYVQFCRTVKGNWNDELKNELGRKFLHIFTVIIIIFFWHIGSLLEDLGILGVFGLENYSFSFWMIITVGYAFVIMFQTADLIRLNYFYTLPKWAKIWYCSAMRERELDTFVASTPLVLSFVPFVFFPFPVFVSVALITTVADAIACLVGKKFGKKKFNPTSDKTIEGFIAGSFSTFLIVIFSFLIYYPLLPISLLKIIIMAAISSLIFFLTDKFIERISDNITNPFLVGFSMWIILII
ncbi:MAG: Cytidylyltransferase family protein [Promethearchaeota archaeon]|nr:MAG: Cytidylyltransferase family protein [Candidatus Lokiarchaeota archaeon]